MKKNEVRAYNELNKAIGRLGELKNMIATYGSITDDIVDRKFGEVVEIVENALEEFKNTSRPKEEVRQDIIDLLEYDTFETYNLIIDWDCEYIVQEDVDDVFSSASEMLECVSMYDFDALKDGGEFIYLNGDVIMADSDDVVAMVMDYPDDFINYLVESRDDDEGDLNELLAEYENAE